MTGVAGATGAGKSTLVNGVVQGANAMKKDEITGALRAEKPLMQGDKIVFKTGEKATSETSTPSFLIENKFKTSIVDCPGIGDTNTSKEFPNMSSI